MGVERPSPPSELFSAAITAVGFSGMIAQIVLLRELLVTFLGNELSLGIILGNWLILEGAGAYAGRGIENRRDKPALFILTALVFAAALPLCLVLARSLKPFLGFDRGEGLGCVRMLVLSFAVLLPVAPAHGALFTMGARIYASRSRAPAAGTVYFLEVAGTAGGGIVFTYLFLPLLHAVHIVFLVLLLNLLLCLLLMCLRFRAAPPAGRLPALLGAAALAGAACLVGCAWASGHLTALQRLSVQRRWGDLRVLFYENSPYGNVAVTAAAGQHDFYIDGIPAVTLPDPDIAAAEDFVHFPFLYHPSPRRVLLISGGAGGVLREMTKHDVESVDYVELDPLLFTALDRFADSETRKEWRNPKVTLHLTDGRRFLAGAEGRYDLILVGLSCPTDLQINRMYSREFFELAGARLNPGGILFFTLPGSYTYLNRELKHLNACVFNPLGEVFRHVEVIPGDVNLYLASQDLDFSSLGAEALKIRLDERNPDVRLFSPYYIDYRLRADRREWLAGILASARVRGNRDFRPAGVFYSLGLWNAQFSPRVQELFRSFERLTPAAAAGFCLLLTAILARLRRKPGRGRADVSLLFAVAGSGFCAMLFDLMIVFSFQIRYGSVYHRIGLIIAAFMAGTGLGSLTVSRRLEKLPRRLRALLILEAGLVAACLLLPAWIVFGTDGFRFGELSFFAVPLLCGVLIGAEFPLAVALALEATGDFSRSVGVMTAADLLGGWGAGIFGAVVLLPVLGLFHTCLLLALLKLCSLTLLALSRRREAA